MEKNRKLNAIRIVEEILECANRPEDVEYFTCLLFELLSEYKRGI